MRRADPRPLRLVPVNGLHGGRLRAPDGSATGRATPHASVGRATGAAASSWRTAALFVDTEAVLDPGGATACSPALGAVCRATAAAGRGEIEARITVVSRTGRHCRPHPLPRNVALIL